MSRSFYTIGIDSGTQSTKAVLMDVRTGRTAAMAAARYRLYEKADGSREQAPRDWIAAGAEDRCGGRCARRGLPVRTGAGHRRFGAANTALCRWTKNGAVIRRAKLWNDASTQRQCEYC